MIHGHIMPSFILCMCSISPMPKLVLWSQLPLCYTLFILKLYKNSQVVWSASPIPKILLCFLIFMCVLMSLRYILVGLKFYSLLLKHPQMLNYNNFYISIILKNFYICVFLNSYNHLRCILVGLKFYSLLLKHAQMLNYNNFHISIILKNFYIYVLLNSYNHLTIPRYLRIFVSLVHSNYQIYSHLYIFENKFHCIQRILFIFNYTR